MAIKGSLREAGLADVCQLLSIGKKTGCLSVTDRSRFGQVFFDRGRITFSTIVNRRDRLGDLLLRDGAITREQLDAAVDEQARQPDRRLGELLLERGVIDGDTLTGCIRRQIEEAIYYLFTWRRGNFYFEPGKAPAAGEITISVNPETLLLEGARRVDEWSVIEKKIPALDLIFDVDAERVRDAEVRLTDEQELLLPLIDGDRTVEELAERSGLTEFDAGKALYGLIQAGFAHRTGRRDAATDADVIDTGEALNLGIAFYRTDMNEDAAREFRRVVESDPHHVAGRHYLALIALRQRDAAAAVQRLASLLETTGPDVDAYLNLATALRVQRRHADALRVLHDARRIAPDDARVRLATGVTALFSGDAATAVARLGEYREMVPTDTLPPPVYYYGAALAAAVEGRIEDAETMVEEGLGAHPASSPLLLLAGNLAERRPDMAAAEQYYRQAMEEDPTLAHAQRNLGDVVHRRGEHAEALDHYRRAVESDPELGDEIYTRLADLHYRRNERDEAIRCWRRALELNPDNQQARNHLEVMTRARR